MTAARTASALHIGLWAVLTLTPIVGFSEAGVSADSVLVGQSAPLSGSLAEFGKSARTGALAYLQTVNAGGGVHGRRIELRTLDDGGDAKRTVQNVTQLIDRDRVFLIFGLVEGGPTSAAVPVITARKVPLVGAMAGSPGLRRPVNRYVFNVRAEHLEEFRAMLNLAKTYGMRRIGFLHSDSEVGRAHLENVHRIADELAMEIVFPAALKSGAADTDFQAIADRIVADKVEVFFNHGSYSSFAKVVQESRKLGAPTHFMAVNSGSSELARLLGEQASGIIFAQIMPIPYTRTTELAREYQRAMKRHFPNEPLSYGSLEAYASARVLVEGLRRTGRDLAREGFVNALETIGVIDLGGVLVRYSPSSHVGSTFVDLVIYGKSGRFVN